MRPSSRLLIGALLLLEVLAAPQVSKGAGALIFANGFETGRVCSWSAAMPQSACVPGPPPTLSLFLLNGTSGYPLSSPVTNPVATFELEAASSASNAITEYCIRHSSSMPSAEDACWRPAPGVPAPTLAISGEPVRLAFLPGIAILYAFVRDEEGNISALMSPAASGEGKDHARADYQPGVPPTVDNVFVTTTADACPEFSVADLDTTTSPDLFLRWNVEFQAFPSEDDEIRVEYTTDDVVFTEIPGSPLANGVNGGGCLLSVCGHEFSGCYKLADHGLPDTYLRFRLKARNQQGAVTVRSAVPPLNVADTLRFVAGNPDPGIDGSAMAAVFNNRVDRPSFHPDLHSVVVNKWGVVLFRDRDNGVLWVDPDSGILSRVAQTTGVATDGPLSGPTPATFIDPAAIFMTHEGDVLVWDGTTIRRINVDADGEPAQVETVIGSLPSYAAFPCTSCSIVALPGGDFYFTNGVGPPGVSGWKIYRHTAEGTEAIVPSGVGYSWDPAMQIQTCLLYELSASYDPVDGTVRRLHAGVLPGGGGDCVAYGNVSMDATGVSVTTGDAAAQHLPRSPAFSDVYVTGLDGMVYRYSEFAKSELHRYDDRTGALQSVLGASTVSATQPPCPAGTLAVDCAAHPHDIFVDAQGAVFWSSLGRIRAIGFDDTVVDIFGQGLDYGEGGDALNARIASASTLNVWNDGSAEHVSYVDNVNSRIREATVGGTVIRRAGNGVVGYPTAGALDAPDEPLWTPAEASFLQDSDGTIYLYSYDLSSFSPGILRNTNPASPWQLLVGGGNTPYGQADGQPGDQIELDAYQLFPFGLTPNRVDFALFRLDGVLLTFADGMVKSYAKSDGTQLHIAGAAGPLAPTCADETPRETCNVYVSYYWPPTRPFFDAPRERWIWQDLRPDYFGSAFLVFDDDGDGGPPGALKSSLTAALPFAVKAWTYRREALEDAFYLCKSNGRLARAVFDGSSWSASELTWPIESLKCAGQDLVWSSDGKRILFLYRQFGLGGIAAYVIDP